MRVDGINNLGGLSMSARDTFSALGLFHVEPCRVQSTPLEWY